MNGIFLGLAASLFFCVALNILFVYERKRGIRFGERIRARLDFFVIKCEYFVSKTFWHVRRETVKQTIHFLFHLILTSFLRLTKHVETLLRRTMHINKKLAKTTEKDPAIKTKLDELTLHKAATTMTESQKKKHKEKVLNG